MQLHASTVNWAKLANLQFDGTIGKALRAPGEHLFLGDPPWPSDSTIVIFELCDCYEAIKDEITEPTRSNADKIMSTLIDSSFNYPWELKNFQRADHYIGAISPASVSEYLNAFAKLNYSELDSVFDSQMPPEIRTRSDIAQYPSKEVFTGYLQQWEKMFKYAAKHGAGVLLHCG